MNIVNKEFLSSDGIHTVKGVVYIPDGDIVGTVQIVHGMTEYIERYDEFMSKLADCGYLAFGHNHLGHRGTVSDDELGFIAHKGGHEHLVADVLKFGEIIEKEYPNKKRYLIGHSMGSFVARVAAVQVGSKLSGLIICGTGGSNPLTNIGLFLCNTVRLFKGEKHISPFLYKLTFGTYNQRFTEGGEFDWLSVDRDNIAKYEKDKYCTFKFTVSALHDLISINKQANSKKWFKALPHDLPILLISGEDDPVGNYGKGVSDVYDRIKKVGCNVKMKLYKGMRHEIFNDICREEVISDVIKFISE
ncbi:MAG: alpha/beta fold hydrolase [Acutalibacteraceae bacterium]